MKKNLYSPFIIALLMIFTLPVAIAFDCGFESPTPSSSGTLSGNDILNVSFSNIGTTERNLTMSYFLQSSAISRNTTLAKLTNQTNKTSLLYTNITFYDSYAFDDAPGYTLSCTCANSTATIDCNATRTSVIIDRTNPAAPTAISFDTPVEDADTITATIDRVNANRCYIQFGGNPLQAMTLSGTTCTYTMSKYDPPNGAYAVVVSADDRTDTRVGAAAQDVIVSTVKNDGGGFLGGATLQMPQSSGTASVQSALGISSNPFQPNDNKKTIAWILAGVAAYLLLFKKK